MLHQDQPLVTRDSIVLGTHFTVSGAPHPLWTYHCYSGGMEHYFGHADGITALVQACADATDGCHRWVPPPQRVTVTKWARDRLPQ